MEIEVSYFELINEIQPSLEHLSNLVYGSEVPISHYMNIADNQKKAEEKSAYFWEVREKILMGLVSKDEGGEIIFVKSTNEKGEETKGYQLTDLNKEIWEKKFKELQDTKVTLDLNLLDRDNFQGVKDLKPIYLRGCLKIIN